MKTGARLVRYGTGKQTHIQDGRTGKPMCDSKAKGMRESQASVATCYRCLKIGAINVGKTEKAPGLTRVVRVGRGLSKRTVRAPKRKTTNIIPDGRFSLAGYVKPTGYAGKRAGAKFAALAKAVKAKKARKGSSKRKKVANPKRRANGRFR